MVLLAVFWFILKPSSNIEKMTPETADVFVTAYLDPSLDQKMNLANLVHKFPKLQNDQQVSKSISDGLNQAFVNAGLSFDIDIKPWLGSRIAFALQTGTNVPAAVLVDSRDDGKAKAFLNRIRKIEEGKGKTWSDTTYQGVTISIGTTSADTTAQPDVYAYLDRTVVIGNSESLVKELVDTDQGKKPRLVDSSGYKSMNSVLPSDRLLLLYVSGKRLIGQLKDQLQKTQAGGTPIATDQINQLDAFTGLGFTISARSDGLAGDLELKIDSSKLNAASRAALTASSGRNRLLSWVPARAYGLFAATGLKQSLQTGADQALASSPDAKQTFDQMGLTGTNGALAHLTGDMALEVSPGSAAAPGGTLLVGTDSAGSLQNFLDKLGTTLVDSGSVADLKVQTQAYKGTTITSLTAPSLTDQGYAPAYTVTGAGVAIIGSSPEQVQAAIDANQAGPALPSAAKYKTAVGRADQDAGTVLYVDISEAARTVRGALSGDQLSSYDRDVAPNVQPLSAFILTSKNQSDRVSEKVFLLIQ